MEMLMLMVDWDPDKRPSARNLLCSDLYLDKDQVMILNIKHILKTSLMMKCWIGFYVVQLVLIYKYSSL